MSSNDPHSSARPRNYYLGAAVLVLIGLVIGLGLSAGLDLHRVTPTQPAAMAATTVGGSGLESPFVTVVQRALPAVVFVDVKKKTAGGDSDDPQEELFRRFFGGDTPRRPRVTPSSGSGFVIDGQGHVLTNNHVVRDASEITVTLNDRRSFKAHVVGTDPETDVAVIQIDGKDLPVLPLGDSDELRVGDWAIAIGNPLGQLRGSVTVGIISATGRSDLNIFGGTPAFQDFIQTDASINFGNSGGPLCNIRGEAIGINTAINPSGQGIGFAIPINLVKHVADQLIAHGTVKRAWMGIQLAELTPEIAEGFGLDASRGILVQSVLDNTPAQQAGLRRNDVILEFDGQSVTDVQKFRLKVADTPIGRKVPIVVLRDGKRITLDVTLGERNEQSVAQEAPAGGDQPDATEGLVGLRVRDLSDDEKKSAKVRSGVIVTDVAEGSTADDSGIQPGDVIEEVGGRPVPTADGFVRTLKDAKSKNKKHVVLLVNTRGQTRFVAIRTDG